MLRRFPVARGLVAGRRAGDDVARLDEGVVVAVLEDFLLSVLNEFIDVALVVREKNEALEMPRLGPGIVGEADQRQIHPLGIEQRQRVGQARRGQVGAVGDGIVDAREVGQGKAAAQGLDPVGGQGGRGLLDGEGQGDRPVADPDPDRTVVIAHEQLELLEVVGPEQPRTRHRRPERAGALKLAIGQIAAEVDLGRLDDDPDIGIAGDQGVALFVPLEEAGESLPQGLYPRVVDFLDAIERRLGVLEGLQTVGDPFQLS